MNLVGELVITQAMIEQRVNALDPVDNEALINRKDAGAARRAALERWAQRREVSFAQAATAWLLARSEAMLPIPGTSSVTHLEDNVLAGELRFTPEELLEIG